MFVIPSNLYTLGESVIFKARDGYLESKAFKDYYGMVSSCCNKFLILILNRDTLEY